MNEERTSQDSIPQVVISDEINSLIPMSSDKSETENKPFFKKLLKSLGGITEHDINALIPAEDAYLRATYGKWTNKKVMLKELINKINESIKVRLGKRIIFIHWFRFIQKLWIMRLKLQKSIKVMDIKHMFLIGSLLRKLILL